MVKSPWKLLTGLLSRGKTTDQHDVGKANITEISNEVGGPGANSNAAEASIAGEPAPEPKPPAASQGGDGEAADRQEPSTAAELPDSMPADEAPTLARGRAVVVIGAEQRNRQDRIPRETRRKVKVEAPGYTKDAESAATLVELVAPKAPDPDRALNSEIRELRSQLAAKLRLQNNQLRQMLSRFEPK